MKNFIDPSNIARVTDLPLIAKRIAEGFLQGIQSSRQRGLGIEFNQYRPYEIGDELSRIDWKLFARSDRYFVREAERESEINVWFLLDISRSMLKSNELLDQLLDQSLNDSLIGSQIKVPHQKYNRNKLEYSKLLIASLAYLVESQGDEFGFIGLSSNHLSFVPKANGKRHWHKLLLELNQTDVGDYFPPIDMIENHLTQLNRPSIIILLSDFYQHDEEIISFLSKLNRSQSEVVAFRLFSKNENKLDLGKNKRKRMIKFRDVETNEELLVSAKSAESSYVENYQKHIHSLERKFKKLGIESLAVNINEPIENTLSHYLNKRLKVKR